MNLRIGENVTDYGVVLHHNGYTLFESEKTFNDLGVSL